MLRRAGASGRRTGTTRGRPVRTGGTRLASERCQGLRRAGTGRAARPTRARSTGRGVNPAIRPCFARRIAAPAGAVRAARRSGCCAGAGMGDCLTTRTGRAGRDFACPAWVRRRRPLPGWGYGAAGGGLRRSAGWPTAGSAGLGSCRDDRRSDASADAGSRRPSTSRSGSSSRPIARSTTSGLVVASSRSAAGSQAWCSRQTPYSGDPPWLRARRSQDVQYQRSPATPSARSRVITISASTRSSNTTAAASGAVGSLPGTARSINRTNFSRAAAGSAASTRSRRTINTRRSRARSAAGRSRTSAATLAIPAGVTARSRSTTRSTVTARTASHC